MRIGEQLRGRNDRGFVKLGHGVGSENNLGTVSSGEEATQKYSSKLPGSSSSPSGDSGNDFGRTELFQLKPLQFLFPRLVDTHMHASQWPTLAIGMEGENLEWRENFADPLEVQYRYSKSARGLQRRGREGAGEWIDDCGLQHDDTF